jgi:hypothetical protein
LGERSARRPAFSLTVTPCVPAGRPDTFKKVLTPGVNDTFSLPWASAVAAPFKV